MKYGKRFLTFMILLSVADCTDTDRARLSAYGNRHRIKQYSGGALMNEWTSTGKVQSEWNSDGYNFKDTTSGNHIRVTGTLVVESLPN